METHHAEVIWKEALALIAQRLNEGTFRIWFGPTAGLGFVDDTFLVGVTSDFARDWIQTRFGHLIRESVSQVLGDTVQCRLVVSPELAQKIGHAQGSDPASAGGSTHLETTGPLPSPAPVVPPAARAAHAAPVLGLWWASMRSTRSTASSSVRQTGSPTPRP